MRAASGMRCHGAAKTCRPPTQVCVTDEAEVSASGGVVRMLPDTTVRSASKPTLEQPAHVVVAGGDRAASRVGVERFVE